MTLCSRISYLIFLSPSLVLFIALSYSPSLFFHALHLPIFPNFPLSQYCSAYLCHTLFVTLLWNFCLTVYLCLHLSRYVRLYWYLIYCCFFNLYLSLLIVSPFLFTGCDWIDLLPLSLSFHASPTLSPKIPLSRLYYFSLYSSIFLHLLLYLSFTLPIATFCNSFTLFPFISLSLFHFLRRNLSLCFSYSLWYYSSSSSISVQ